MAQYGEWTRKGATLSEVTARKEYGVDSEFVVKGINAGKLEYREGSIHGNPYIRVLRGQLEEYVVEKLGDDYLRTWQEKAELQACDEFIRPRCHVLAGSGTGGVLQCVLIQRPQPKIRRSADRGCVLAFR